jgi:hypothetical protein
MLGDKRIMSGLSIFAESVPPDKQLEVLRGQTFFAIPFSQLSEQGRAYVKSESALTGLTDYEPEKAVFRTTYDDDLSPCMFMFLGKLGGHGYLGGLPMEYMLHRKLAAQWMQPGDQRTNDAAARKMGPFEKQEPPIERGHLLERRFEQLAQVSKLSLIARIPGPHLEHGPGPPNNETIGHYLNEMLSYLPHVQHKWRDNILLLSYPAWFRHAETNTPYEKLKLAGKAH